MNLVDFLQALVDDPTLLTRFKADPNAVMADANLSAADQQMFVQQDTLNNKFSILGARDNNGTITVLQAKESLVGTFGVDPEHDVVRVFEYEGAASEGFSINMQHAFTGKTHPVKITHFEIKIFAHSIPEAPKEPVQPAQAFVISNAEKTLRFALVTKISGIDEYSRSLNGFLNEKHNHVSVSNGQILYAYDLIDHTYHAVETKKIVLHVENSDA